jgi:hypothetical protein
MGRGNFHAREDIQSKKHDTPFSGWHTLAHFTAEARYRYTAIGMFA